MRNFIVFVFAVICYVNAIPVAEESGSQNGYNRNYGNWPQFPQLPQLHQFQGFPQIQWPQMPKPITPQDVENMKPVPGGVYNGMSQVVSSHTEYVNGKPVTKTQGHVVFNDNGTVKEQTFGN